MLHARRATERLDQLEQGALLWCARECLLTLQQRRDVVPDAHDAPRLHARMRLRRAGQQSGQNCAHHHAQRDDVILRDPARQREQSIIQRRLGVGHGGNGLDDAAGWGRGVERDDYPDLLSLPERHDNAAADSRLMLILTVE
jgi:hypothetical protein